MATIQRYVNTGSTAGGDGTTNNTTGADRAFASLSAWEAAMGAGNAADDYIVDCCGTAADTTAVTLSFSANSVLIRGNRSDPAGFYDGPQLISESQYRLRVTGAATPITNLLNNSTIDGIQVITANASSTYGGIEDSAATGATVVRNCRVMRDPAVGGLGGGVGVGQAGTAGGGGNGHSRTYENNIIVGYQHPIRLRMPDFWTRAATVRHNTLYVGAGNNAAILIADQGSADCDYIVSGNACGNTGTQASIARTLGSSSTFASADNAVSVASSTTDEIALGAAADAWVSPGTGFTADFGPKNTGSLYQAVNPTLLTTDITGFTRDGASHDVGALEYRPPGPTITDQPDDVTVTDGDAASFTVAATASAGSLTYQWQIDSGSGFGNVSNGGVYSGATSATLSIDPAALALDGNLYRCNVSDSNGTVASASALLTVNPVPLSVTLTLTGENNVSVGAVTIPKVFAIRYSDNTLLHTFTGVTTNAGGQVTLTHASLTATDIVFVPADNSGSKLAGAKFYTPA